LFEVLLAGGPGIPVCGNGFLQFVADIPDRCIVTPAASISRQAGAGLGQHSLICAALQDGATSIQTDRPIVVCQVLPHQRHNVPGCRTHLSQHLAAKDDGMPISCSDGGSNYIDYPLRFARSTPPRSRSIDADTRGRIIKQRRNVSRERLAVGSKPDDPCSTIPGHPRRTSKARSLSSNEES
jgi:hypothetical protein